ncbi:4Fe-4S binding protein [Desulfoplanes sp. PS50]|jgi:NADH-quinone oxidoreductase subunit I
MTFLEDIRQAIKGLYSLIIGLGITGRALFSKTKTVHYPRQTVDNIDTYHGHIEFVPTDEPSHFSKCIACGTCVRNCPSQCITMEKAELPPEIGEDGKLQKPKKAKYPSLFEVDYNYCSLCGQCVENCPTKALRFSTDVYLAGFSRSDFDYDLIERSRKVIEDRKAHEDKE